MKLHKQIKQIEKWVTWIKVCTITDFLVGTSMIEQVNESVVDFLLKESITVTKIIPTSYVTQLLS